jgi:pyruvate ferredoxin oxidoreductase beta subunit
MERGHDMLMVCYDNEAYMNTGIQRSSATPRGAATTTSPAGRAIPGKREIRKDLTSIMVAHKIPYVAQASPSHWQDLVKKVEKALEIRGPKFMNILMPCTLGWRFMNDQGIAMAKLAVETCFWPLYEVENGKYNVTYKPREKRPISEFIEKQGRFSHLRKEKNKHIIDELQKETDGDWEELLKRTESR